MSGPKQRTKRKFLIDTDAGLDDAQAILMALSHGNDIDVVAITTVHGNASANQVSLNVLSLLKMADRLDVSRPTSYVLCMQIKLCLFIGVLTSL